MCSSERVGEREGLSEGGDSEREPEEVRVPLALALAEKVEKVTVSVGDWVRDGAGVPVAVGERLPEMVGVGEGGVPVAEAVGLPLGVRVPVKLREKVRERPRDAVRVSVGVRLRLPVELRLGEGVAEDRVGVWLPRVTVEPVGLRVWEAHETEMVGLRLRERVEVRDSDGVADSDPVPEKVRVDVGLCDGVGEPERDGVPVCDFDPDPVWDGAVGDGDREPETVPVCVSVGR